METELPLDALRPSPAHNPAGSVHGSVRPYGPIMSMACFSFSSWIMYLDPRRRGQVAPGRVLAHAHRVLSSRETNRSTRTVRTPSHSGPPAWIPAIVSRYSKETLTLRRQEATRQEATPVDIHANITDSPSPSTASTPVERRKRATPPFTLLYIRSIPGAWCWVGAETQTKCVRYEKYRTRHSRPSQNRSRCIVCV